MRDPAITVTALKQRQPPVPDCDDMAVIVAASSGHGRLYVDLYSVAPAGIFVPPNSPVRKPADLAGVPIPVQLSAYYAAVLKGTDIDQSRNLARSSRTRRDVAW